MTWLNHGKCAAKLAHALLDAIHDRSLRVTTIRGRASKHCVTIIERAPWPIVIAVGLHVALALACLLALAFWTSPPLLGVHPAVKPLKFAVSVSLFLATMAWLLASMEVDRTIKMGFAWTFSLTMAVEMTAITIQAIRRVPSHFNASTPLDAALWRTMGTAIVIIVLACGVVAVLATTHTLRCDPAVALALRAGLWIMLLAAVSGFAMGGRGAHSVQGADGGPGLPITNWSTSHGDLRVSHFWSLHGFQALPVLAWSLLALGIDARIARIVVAVAIAAWIALTLFTLAQAFAGRAFLAMLMR